MIVTYLVGALGISLGLVAGGVMAASKVLRLYERVERQEIVIADLIATMGKIATALDNRLDNSGREIAELANDTLARHTGGPVAR